MTNINYQALREKAEKATWGDWDSYKPHRGARGYKVRLSGQAIAQHVLKNNAEFIAAFNPKVALALLDERERNQQYIKSRDQENEDIALTVGKLRVELEAAEKRIAELESLTAPQLPQPAPVSVPEVVGWEDVPEEITEDDIALASAWAHGFNQCRAAMLQGAEPVTTAYKSPGDFICMLTGRAKYLREKGEIKSPELLERAAAALQDEIVNTPPIPNGWKLVPIDPTKDMLRAGQSVVGFWLNTVHCYSKMLAAAPAAPQQEVKK